MLTIPLDVAVRIARKRLSDAGAELILPDDPRRLAVVGLVAAGHALQRTGVTSEHVDQSVTVTLPGAPGAVADGLALVPVVGRYLAAIGRGNGRTAVYLSRAAMADGVTLLATVEHELGHVGTIAAGGLVWCGVYLLVPEARAAGEAPCYGAGMAVRVACGASLTDVAAEAKRSLGSYGLDAPARALADAMVDGVAATIAATGDCGGVVAELRPMLAAEGVTL